jgi:arsenate reductase
MTIRAPFKILFLCTDNSARSIFGEYFIRKLGKGRFQSYSAGADPRPKVNPYALSVLQESFKLMLPRPDRSRGTCTRISFLIS